MPFRCAKLEGRPQPENYYFAELSLERAVEWWHLVRTWECRLGLYFGEGLSFNYTIDALRLLEESEVAVGRGARGFAEWSGRVELNGGYVSVRIAFGEPDPRRDGSQYEKAYWSGVHAVRRAGLLVPGMVRPGVFVEVDGFVDVGSEFTPRLNNLAGTDGSEFRCSMDGETFWLARVGEGGLITASLEIVPKAPWEFANADLKAVYNADFNELLNPLYAKVP